MQVTGADDSESFRFQVKHDLTEEGEERMLPQ